MIDLKYLERNFEDVVKKLRTRKIENEILSNLKNSYIKLKKEKQKLEDFLKIKNEKSKLFSTYMREKKSIEDLKEELEENKKNINETNLKLQNLEDKLKNIALNIPNIPNEDVPIGLSEKDNIVIKNVLEKRKFNFKIKDHHELSQTNKWIDFQRGVKLAKSRFSVLLNEGASLERALINYMLDFNKKRGFKEYSLPYLANEKSLIGTGQLPKFKEDLFKIEDEELYLIPTAEVSLTNLYANEIINEEDLPIKLTSYTPCFRKEAGSGGKDIRGIIRQHQFHKVELVSITKAENSYKIFDEMVQCASDLLSSLNLPHRLVSLCTADMSFGSAKTVDLEVWLPGQDNYREISSISNTTDYQARRSMIRYKKDKKNLLVHTLNGSSLAVGRTLVAIMENYQREDGSIEIPEVLKKYLNY